MIFYDSLLPHVARGDELDRVSTAGYAIGYLGGGVLLAINLAWIQQPAWFGLPDAGVGDPRCRSSASRSGGRCSRSRCSARVPEPPVDRAQRVPLGRVDRRVVRPSSRHTLRELRRYRRRS